MLFSLLVYIYIYYVHVSVVCQITWNHVNQTRECYKSVLGGKIRPVTPVLFISTRRSDFTKRESAVSNFHTNSIPRKLPIGNSRGYFTRYIEIVREICNSTARVK